MIFPIQELIEYSENMYEITAACSKRAGQLSLLKEPKESYDEKTVSIAARQIFTKDVEFRLEGQ